MVKLLVFLEIFTHGNAIRNFGAFFRGNDIKFVHIVNMPHLT